MAETTRGRKRDTNRRVYESEQKRPTITFRVRDELHAKLKASAEARGYSLSEEIEHRLNLSMDTARDPFAEAALRLISDNWRAIQALTKQSMGEDGFTLRACCEAAARAPEMLGEINKVPSGVGVLEDLTGSGPNIEAAKKLGSAIIWHRELSAMREPDERLVDAYREQVVDALVERAAFQHLRASQAAKGQRGAAPPPSTGLPAGMSWATQEEVAAAEDVPGLLPPEIGDRAAFDDAAAELPLERAEKEAARNDPLGRPQRVMFGWLPQPTPAEKPAPERRGRGKASAEG